MPSEGGKFVDFFGLRVPMSAAAEKLALKTGVPITFMFCAPRTDGTYLLHSPPPITPDSEAENAGITQTIAHLFEEEVTRNPAYWIWMYKRWKYVPDGEDMAAYPFYSKRIEDTERQDGEDI
jgi:KDO2-lipid IV(A) lauroyltransferase